VRAGRQRAARRAAQDELAIAAAHEQRDVRMALAERRDGELAGVRRDEPALGEERQQRLEDDQRLTLRGRRRGVRGDHVVGGQRRAHRVRR
jgi:hypothetical protein